MFVCIIGNVEQNIFKLWIAVDPLKGLSNVQVANPYKLSVISKVCVKNRNAATLIERLSRQSLSQYEGAGEWIVNAPASLSTQFVNGRYLPSLARQAGVQVIQRDEYATPAGSDNLQRLSPLAKRRGLTFEEILGRVEQAYDESRSIDEII